MDLDSGSASDIENSRYQVNPVVDRGGCPYHCYIIHRTLNLGPDGHIYVSLRDAAYFDYTIAGIEFPERDRQNVSYKKYFLTVKNIYKFINVSYIRSASFSAKENGILAKKKVCVGLPTEFSLLYNRVDSVKWDFGDPASGSNNYSTALAPSHNYASVNVYTITAIIYRFCNTDTATLKVSIDPDPIVHIPTNIKDTIVCVGSKILIDAATSSATGYIWSDGLIRSYRQIDKAGIFQVRAYNACSEDQKSFTVSFKECPCDVFIPSAFTPNNDGLNDDFKPISKCVGQDYNLKIFNRFGSLVFETNEWNKGWDGKYKNLISPTGVFMWVLQYRNPNTNQLVRKQGTITLIQ